MCLLAFDDWCMLEGSWPKAHGEWPGRPTSAKSLEPWTMDQAIKPSTNLLPQHGGIYIYCVSLPTIIAGHLSCVVIFVYQRKRRRGSLFEMSHLFSPLQSPMVHDSCPSPKRFRLDKAAELPKTTALLVYNVSLNDMLVVIKLAGCGFRRFNSDSDSTGCLH